MASAVADGQRISPVVDATAASRSALAEPVDALRAGDAACWERLLVRMERRALSLAWRILGDVHLAADAVQNAYVKAYTNRAALHAGSDVERWLLAISANAARDLARQQARTNSTLQPDEAWAKRADRIAPDAHENELEPRLRAALAKLDDDSRVLFLLVHQEGFTYEAVAKEFGWPLGTVRSTLHRARLKLRELLGARERGPG